MRFANREEAACLLAERLVNYQGQQPLVLGVPRGGVPMARTIANALNGDLDVILVRKLRAPGEPAFVIGAVDERGFVLPTAYARYVDADHLREEVRSQQEILRSRRAAYCRGRPALDPTGRVVIVVDDGMETGASMLAAIRAVRAHRPKRVVVAVAVAPCHTLNAIRRETDDVVCLQAVRNFFAVAQFYADFSEVTDDEVIRALADVVSASTPQHA
jgi:predicted phosphoribosyltransferase